MTKQQLDMEDIFKYGIQTWLEENYDPVEFMTDVERTNTEWWAGVLKDIIKDDLKKAIKDKENKLIKEVFLQLITEDFDWDSAVKEVIKEVVVATVQEKLKDMKVTL